MRRRHGRPGTIVPHLPKSPVLWPVLPAICLIGARGRVPERNVQLLASVAVDLIDEASEESFPASDPPATVATTGSVLGQPSASEVIEGEGPELPGSPCISGKDDEPKHSA
jgi:hypothetical protein